MPRPTRVVDATLTHLERSIAHHARQLDGLDRALTRVLRKQVEYRKAAFRIHREQAEIAVELESAREMARILSGIERAS